VDEIGLRITRGDFEPGQVLPDEDKLAAELDVSRTVIREATKVLLAKGMVETRPRRGTSVRPFEAWNMLDPDVLAWQEASRPGPQFFRNLTEVRRIVEPAAAALAAERATATEMRAVEAAYVAMKDGVDETQAFRAADLKFHAAILVASRNPFLQPVANAIGAVLMSSLMVTNRNPATNRNSLPFHARVLEAIRSRNPEAARRAMQSHLDDTWLRIEGEISVKGGQN
jgi:DNA-binding FadR family transcriptional regulator